MGLGVDVYGGFRCAPICSSLLHLRAYGGEGDRKVLLCLSERSSRIFDRDGDKPYSPRVCLEGRDEGGVFYGLLHNLAVAAEIPGESDLDENEGTFFESKVVGYEEGLPGIPLA